MLGGSGRAAPLLYVARPCQFGGIGSNPRCTQQYWTSHRFAPEVIEATSAVIDQVKKAAGATAIELVGFSGGGAVAVLVAARRTDVTSIRTVAGNLDHVTLHRRKQVSPLSGSLNAADVAAQVSTIPQIHFVGAEDDIIGAYVAESYRSRAAASNCIAIQTVSGASHGDGWRICGPAFSPRNYQTAIKARFLRQPGLMHRMMSPNLLLDYQPLRRGSPNRN